MRHAGSLLGMATAATITIVFGIAPGQADDDDDKMRRLTTPSGLHFYAGPNTSVSDAAADDLFAAGGNVTLAKTTAEDIFVAGGNVSAISAQANNLIAAGGNLSLIDLTATDAILAGGDVDVGGAIADDLIAAGGQVTLRSGATVGGDAVLSGGEIDIAGTIGGDARIAAGEFRLVGSIGGNVELIAGEIELVPGASITGNLTYRSREELKIPEGVTIGGKVERGAALGRMGRERGDMVGRVVAAGIGAWIGLGLSLIVLAAVALAAFPVVLGRAVSSLQERPLASLGLGFALAVAAPVGLAILAATVIGIPLSIAGFSLYVVALALASTVVAMWAGLRLRHRLGRPGVAGNYGLRLGWTALGVLLVMVVLIVPLIGAAAVMIAGLMALGALAFANWGTTSSG